MTPLVPITMFGWIPLVIVLFARLRPRHAVIASYLFAWLFLPMATYDLAGIPAYTKMSATCFGVMMGAFLFDRERFLSYRPTWVDVPMVLWCLCPLASSLSNGLGFYDGLSAVFRYTVTWWLPFLIGRLYFDSLDGLKEFSFGILIGGLCYIPLCLFESRMSPQLHKWVYGYHQHDFIQTIRRGGYRPMVFMKHGLMVGIWMMSAALTGFWQWSTGVVKKLEGTSFGLLVILLFFTAWMVRSTGALLLLAFGTGLLILVSKIKSNIFIVCLLVIPIIYMGSRATNVWDGYNLQEFVANHISMERAQSLWKRQQMETLLAEKALTKPVFGWGGWGRSRVLDEEGGDISTTDGMWIIILGENGIAGLALFTICFIMPVCVFLRRYPVQCWTSPQVAPAAVLSVLLGLYMMDNMLNAMINPIFTVIAGGLAGLQKEKMDTLNNQMDEFFEYSESAPRFL